LIGLIVLLSSSFSVASEAVLAPDSDAINVSEKNSSESLFQPKPEQSQLNAHPSVVKQSCQLSQKQLIDSDSKITSTRLKKSSQSLNVQQEIKLSANRVPENSEFRTVFEGEVRMVTQDSVLSTDHLVSDKQQQTITATGNVQLETKNSFLQAESLVGDQNSKNSKLSGVKFLFYSNQANGKAKSITLGNDNVTTLNQLTYSTCPEGNDSWRFSANELQLDQNNGRGEVWDMWLKVKGVPIFYFPYLNFPIDDQRKSGLLMPLTSQNKKNGLDVSLPTYWNITENADATFIPRSIQNRGSQIAAEFRYLTQATNNELSIEWLNEDRLAKNELLLNPTLAEGDYGLTAERWALSLKNETYWNENWSAGLNATKVSDRDYFRDLGAGIVRTQENNKQPRLLSRAHLSYQDDIWRLSLQAESTQNLSGSEPYRLLPRFVSSADYYHIESGLRWQFDSEFTQFTHADQSLMDGKRLNIMPSVSYPIKNNFLWFTPKLSYQLSQYQQRDPMLEKSFSYKRNLPIFTLDSGLYFDRETKWNDTELIHTLEPRLFYAYIPYREQQFINNFDTQLPEFSTLQLWEANRYVGSDRIGDTNHLSFGLTNRWVNNSSGEPLLNFTLARKFYFEDRNVQLESTMKQTSAYSPWLFEFNYMANQYFELSSIVEWREQDDSMADNQVINLSRSRIKFEPIEDHIVNVSHRFRKKEIVSHEEIDLSFVWPINDEWRLVGRWYNDLQTNQVTDRLFGFEYESCCWAVSLISRHYLDVELDVFGNRIMNPIIESNDEFNSEIKLQFVFKGFGQSDKKSVSQLLSNSIRGYHTRF